GDAHDLTPVLRHVVVGDQGLQGFFRARFVLLLGLNILDDDEIAMRRLLARRSGGIYILLRQRGGIGEGATLIKNDGDHSNILGGRCRRDRQIGLGVFGGLIVVLGYAGQLHRGIVDGALVGVRNEARIHVGRGLGIHVRAGHVLHADMNTAGITG